MGAKILRGGANGGCLSFLYCPGADLVDNFPIVLPNMSGVTRLKINWMIGFMEYPRFII
jgi:hypothetical protein